MTQQLTLGQLKEALRATSEVASVNDNQPLDVVVLPNGDAKFDASKHSLDNLPSVSPITDVAVVDGRVVLVRAV